VTTWRDLLDAFSRYNLGEGEKPSVPRSVVVIGGGSVAMDVACAAGRLGADEIDVVCLESPREMPAYHDELAEVWEEGVRFHTRSMPIEITQQAGQVTGLRAVRIRWKEPDRFVPANAEPIAGTEYWLPGQMVVFAIGARPSEELAAMLAGIERDAASKIAVDPQTQATSRPGVYAGGDVAADGGMTIVRSVAEGKRAGQAMDAWLRG
jgi:NADPH-dependent glutamate synthase beta subunit-like oxidoreductase